MTATPSNITNILIKDPKHGSEGYLLHLGHISVTSLRSSLSVLK